MIVSVRGVLEATGADWVHLRVGGVTLQVSVPARAVERLGALGSEISLYTHLRIRDEQAVIYGFPDAASLAVFNLLTGISGVGPRLGLSLISTLDPGGLQQAVAAGDVAALSGAPGVGRRTASRIVLELKGKIDLTDGPENAPVGDGEVIAALTALGYSAAEAKSAVDGLPAGEDLSTDDRIRLALQQFANRG